MIAKTVAVLPSGARTALQSVQFDNTEGRKYLDLIVDITTYTAGSLTITINGVDPVSGKKYALLASAALAAAATTALRIGPGITVAANLSAACALPPKVSIDVAVGDATSITYSIGATLRD